jgi:hypothetical protein
MLWWFPPQLANTLLKAVLAAMSRRAAEFKMDVCKNF